MCAALAIWVCSVHTVCTWTRMAGNCFVCIELYEYVPTKSKRLIFITMNPMQFDWKRNLHNNTEMRSSHSLNISNNNTVNTHWLNGKPFLTLKPQITWMLVGLPVMCSKIGKAVKYFHFAVHNATRSIMWRLESKFWDKWRCSDWGYETDTLT